jgi:L-fuculose-phosphate aldolase
MNSDLLSLSISLSNFVVGMEGNISKKTNDGIIIKASGSNLRNLSESDLVSYNFKGEQTNNYNKKGSMELSFHLYLLENYNIKYVAHTHPTNTLKILVSDKINEFADKRLFPDQVIFNGKKSCIIPYSLPGQPLTDTIKTYLNRFIEEENYFPNLILLKNHGIIVCGNSIEECIYGTEICEKSAEIFLTNYTRNYLSDTEINELINDEQENIESHYYENNLCRY